LLIFFLLFFSILPADAKSAVQTSEEIKTKALSALQHPVDSYQIQIERTPIGDLLTEFYQREDKPVLIIVYYGDSESTIREIDYFKDETMEGNQSKTYFYKNGQVQKEESYLGGSLHGSMKSYFENGTIREEVKFENNFPIGEAVTYYENGQKETVVSYEFVKVDNTKNQNLSVVPTKIMGSKGYYEDGKPKFEMDYKESHLQKSKSFFPDGKIKWDWNFIEGIWDSKNNTHFPYLDQGTYRSYFDNGAVESEIEVKNNQIDGMFKEYFMNGKVREEVTFKEGKPNGVWKIYYESGKLWQEQTFDEGTRHGRDLHYSYIGTGTEIKEITYIDGKAIKSKISMVSGDPNQPTQYPEGMIPHNLVQDAKFRFAEFFIDALIHFHKSFKGTQGKVWEAPITDDQINYSEQAATLMDYTWLANLPMTQYVGQEAKIIYLVAFENLKQFKAKGEYPKSRKWVDEMRSTLYATSAYFVAVLMTELPDSEGNRSYLDISSKEREELVKKLDQGFGGLIPSYNSVLHEQKFKENDVSTYEIASFLRHELTNPKLKNIDDRPSTIHAEMMNQYRDRSIHPTDADKAFTGLADYGKGLSGMIESHEILKSKNVPPPIRLRMHLLQLNQITSNYLNVDRELEGATKK
jgi:antitoxin component YwqK of YwqJK toxin-antitoxin module